MSAPRDEAKDLPREIADLHIRGTGITNLSALAQPAAVGDTDILATDEDGADAADDDDEPENLENDPEALQRYIEQYGLADEVDDEDGFEEVDDEEADAPGGRQDVLIDDSIQGFFDHRDDEKENAVFCVVLCPTNPSLCLSGDQVDRAFLWNTQTGERLFELLGHTDSVIGGAFSADGRLVATASMDSTCRVWEVATGKLIQTLEGPAAEIEWVRFHPKGPILLAGSTDGT